MNINLSDPINIGTKKITNRVFLAPLAGITDIPFRRICQEFGAGLTYVEMLSAMAMHYVNMRTFAMAQRHSSEVILGAQVEGACPDAIAESIGVLDKMGFDTIDINMGCPVRKVVNAGGGSGLLRTPSLISEILVAARQATSKPLSLKFRLGFTRDNITVEDTTRRAVAAGFQMITIHGRTRSEDYSIPVDLHGIALGVKSAREIAGNSVVVIGNGNIFSLQDAQTMLEKTGCDGVMISRGALGNPWIFREIITGQIQDVTISEWYRVVLQHLLYTQEEFSDNRHSAVSFRKHLLWYARGFVGVKELRANICAAVSLNAMKELLDKFVENRQIDELRILNTSESNKFI